MNCLTEWFYEEGLAQARELDEALEKGGHLKGALHGVPIALKVNNLPAMIPSLHSLSLSGHPLHCRPCFDNGFHLGQEQYRQPGFRRRSCSAY